MRRRFNGAKHITEARALAAMLMGRGAFSRGRSRTGRTGGRVRSENAGINNENYIRIVMAENLRFPWEGSSATGKPGAKARPEGVVDAHTVENP